MIHGDTWWCMMMIYDVYTWYLLWWWYMMIHDDDTWCVYMMCIHDDTWWYFMMYIWWWYMMMHDDDTWWCMMIYDDTWWCMVMIHDDTWWCLFYNTLWCLLYDTLWCLLVYLLMCWYIFYSYSLSIPLFISYYIPINPLLPGVMNAARSLIGVFRELNPEMLRKKDRVRLLWLRVHHVTLTMTIGKDGSGELAGKGHAAEWQDAVWSSGCDWPRGWCWCTYNNE